jgi:hypothetical protein
MEGILGSTILGLMLDGAVVIESLLADFDHDGHVGSSEINLIKENLHHIFDVDASGDIDTKEIKSVRGVFLYVLSDLGMLIICSLSL